MWNTFDKELLKDQYKVNRWDETRGLPLEKLEEGCREIQTRLAGQSMQRIKSEMLVYLLEHMQFEVNPNEFFQNKLNRGNFTWELLWKHQEICREPALEGVWNSFQEVCDCTSMEASMDFGHLAPDWKFVLTAGIPGIVNRLEEYAGQTQDPGKLEFYRCGQNVWLAIATLLRRMAESAKAIGGEKMEFVAANMLHLAEHAPETLAQAMELMLLVYEIQTQMDNANVRSLGGLDRMFHPLYRKDLDSGRFTEAQLRELIRDFLFKISTMAVTANTPFYLAGRYLDGTDASNELSCVLMEEYRTLDIVDPKIHVMYHPEMSPKLLQLLLLIGFVVLVGLIKGDAESALVSGTVDGDLHRVPGTVALDGIGEILVALNGLVATLCDDVTRLDTGLFRRAAGLHVFDVGSFRHVVILCYSGGVILVDGDTHLGLAGDVTVSHQIVGDLFGVVRRNGESQTFHSGITAGRGVFRCSYTDDFTVGVIHRTTGVSAVDGSVHLEHVDGSAGFLGGDIAIQSADHSGGHGELQLTHGVSNGVHRITHTHITA